MARMKMHPRGRTQFGTSARRSSIERAFRANGGA